jgi:hypothetical protein
LVSNPLKTWKEKPSTQEAEQHVRDFFARLRTGDIQGAGAMVAHEYDDWEPTLFTTWEDHYLIHEIAPDDTFEGGAWRDAGWLGDLEIGEFRWDGEEYAVPSFHVEIVYRGEASGYEGEFRVAKTNAGFVITRIAFHA